MQVCNVAVLKYLQINGFRLEEAVLCNLEFATDEARLTDSNGSCAERPFTFHPFTHFHTFSKKVSVSGVFLQETWDLVT